MLLLCTPNSLYSRILRVVAFDLEVDLPIEYVGVRSQADRLLNYNPTGKVPTLVLKDGHVLAESRLICEYLETLSDKAVLATVDAVAGRELEGIIVGFIDGVAVWVREARRDPDDQSSEILTLEENRAHRCLTYFEALVWPSQQLNFAAISLACALELMSMTVSSAWETRFPKLAAWHQVVVSTDKFVGTKPKLS